MIKQPGFNPYPHNLFSVKIFCHHPKEGGTSKFYELFKDYIDKMPLLIQQIDLPQFDITNQAFHVHTQNGEYKSIGNNIVNAQGQLTMKMLDTENSIIAHFFYPWLNIIAYAGVYDIDDQYNICTGNDWPYPRIDIQIDYYLDENVIEYIKNEKNNPTIPSNFTYIFKGCFPYKVQSVNVRHTAPAQGEYIRGVTFQYNNAICIPNAILNKFYGTDVYTLDKYKQQQMQLIWKKNVEDSKKELAKMDAHYKNKKVERSLQNNDKRVKKQIKNMDLPSDLSSDTTYANNITSLRAQQSVVLDRAQHDNYE